MGKTLLSPQRSLLHWKHPHTRGEDATRTRRYVLEEETPPHTWGRPQRLMVMGMALGNTPTHVGKTGNRSAIYRSKWKHPHTRGEDVVSSIGKRWILETPPHTWGRPLSRAVDIPELGNTPTHVGKTLGRVGSHRET